MSIFLMSSQYQCFNIRVSILSHLHIDLRSKFLVLKVVCNLGSSRIKYERVSYASNNSISPEWHL